MMHISKIFTSYLCFFPRKLQTVQIGANVKILDSPGIVIADPILKNNTVLCLKNLVRSDRLTDPIQAAQAILVRATKDQVTY